jgi:RNA polymerase sigma factor (sigma-70 family)
LAECIVNDSIPNPDEVLQNEAIEKELREALAKLSDREVEIIRRYFGFDEGSATMEAIGKRLGVSKERVRQIKKQILTRFRKNRKLR